MEQFLGKKWQLSKSENFDAYLKALGVGLVLRKLAGTTHPTLDFVKHDDDSYTMTSASAVKTQVSKFKLGEEFELERADGKKVKATITMEEGKLIERHKKPGSDTEIETEIVRELKEDDELHAECSIGDIKSQRIYKKI